MLEGHTELWFEVPLKWKKIIRTQAKFLTLVNGRGGFYAFVGVCSATAARLLSVRRLV